MLCYRIAALIFSMFFCMSSPLMTADALVPVNTSTLSELSKILVNTGLVKALGHAGGAGSKLSCFFWLPSTVKVFCEDGVSAGLKSTLLLRILVDLASAANAAQCVSQNFTESGSYEALIGSLGLVGSATSVVACLPATVEIARRHGLASASLPGVRLLIDTLGATTACLVIKHGLGY